MPMSARRPAPPTGTAALLAVSRACSVGALRGRRLVGLLLFVGFPLLVQTAVILWGEGRGAGFGHFTEIFGNAYLRVIVPIALIFLGTAAFGDEWEGGTANYVVGAPISRTILVLGRYLAALRRALLLFLPAVCALYVLCVGRFEGALAHYANSLGWALFGVFLGAVGYTAIFLAIGLLLRRSVMSSFIYVLVFEGFIGSLPRGFASLSLSYHVRNVLWIGTGQPAFEPPDFGIPDLQPTALGDSLFTIVAVSAVALALASWFLRRKEVSSGAASQAEAPG